MLFFFPVSNIRIFRYRRRQKYDFAQNVKIIDMKSFITIAIAGVFFLSSCSTVYRSGQTPDDVYYSPAPEAVAGGTAYAPANSGRTAGKYNANQAYNRGYSGYGYDDFATMDDRWLMMRVRNPYRWSLFDNYSFYSPFNNFYNPYAWGGGFYPGLSFGGGFHDPYGFSYYNHFNSYWRWNSFYNPYAPNIIVVNPKTNPAGYTKARSFNPNTYGNTNTTRRPALAPTRAINNSNSTTRPRYNNSNNYRTTEQSNRQVNQNTPRSRNNETYRPPAQDRPVRTYTPSVNNSSRGSSVPSSSGGGGGSRPSRR